MVKGLSSAQRGIVGTLAHSFATRLLLLCAVLAIVFAALDLLPGSAVRGTLGATATDEAVAARSAELGLDESWPVRFVRWLGGLLTGDLGESVRGLPVSGLLAAALPETLILMVGCLILAIPTSIVVGTWWAAHPRSRRSRVSDGVSVFAIAVPEFVVATLLIGVFALVLDILPAVTTVTAEGNVQTADMRVLPVLALAIPQIGWNTRVVHGAVSDRLHDPHVIQARLEGLPNRQILTRHVLPLAAPTIAASAATSLGMLAGGAVVVETVFNHPGVGLLLSGAVTDQDAVVTVAVLGAVGLLLLAVLTASDAVRLMVTGPRRQA